MIIDVKIQVGTEETKNHTQECLFTFAVMTTEKFTQNLDKISSWKT